VRISTLSIVYHSYILIWQKILVPLMLTRICIRSSTQLPALAFRFISDSLEEPTNALGTSPVKHLNIYFWDELKLDESMRSILHFILVHIPCLDLFHANHGVGLGEIHTLRTLPRHTLKSLSLELSITENATCLRYVSQLQVLEELRLIFHDSVDYAVAVPFCMDSVRNFWVDWTAAVNASLFVFACRFRHARVLHLAWQPVDVSLCPLFAEFLRGRQGLLEHLTLLCSSRGYPDYLAQAVGSCTLRLDLKTPVLPESTIQELIGPNSRVTAFVYG
jgi:hypothetical protein